MKKEKIIRVILHKLAALFIALCVMAGISFSGMNIKAEAAVGYTSTGLPSDSTQSAQARTMGFSTEQQTRLSPSGKVIDKSKNPLGPNNLTLDRICQLAMSSYGSISVYDYPLGKGRMFKDTSSAGPGLLSLANPLTNVAASFSTNPEWADAEKSITAADIDGNGKQEVVTAGLFKIGSDGMNVALHLMISDYNNIRSKKSKDKDYTVVSSMASTSPSQSNTEQYLLTTAGDFNKDGKDEIAIAAGDSLYICKADTNSCKILSSRTYNYTFRFFRTIIDLEAADANGDGFPELLVTTRAGASPSGKGTPYLYIFDGTDVAHPSAQIKLQAGENEYFKSASVTVGDAFGNGNKTILLGGETTKNQVALAYVMFHPETETYDAAPVASYYLDAADFTAVQSDNMGLKCASLKTPVPGNPQYVVLGGFIFLFDSATDAFVRKDVTSSTNTSGLAENEAKKSHGSITNVNMEKDSTYILNTLVGNFDGNTLGEEQVILLHYNKWYNSEYVYATICSMNSSGTINSALLQVWKKSKEYGYAYPAIGMPDIYNQGTRLEFEPGKSTFMFSNPTVLAVLGASPYYEELTDKYGALSGAFTAYGSDSETGTSASNGVTASIGVSFGWEWQIFGPSFKIGFETEITNSFAYTWSKSKSVTKNLCFTSYCDEDAVVAMIIPYDVYFYKVYTYSANTKTTKECEMSMLVPYTPLTTIMPLPEYNTAAAEIPNAPVIGPEVLRHTIGDPRSYPQSSNGLSNVNGKEVLTGGTSKDENANFVAAGVGSSNVSQSITTSASSERSFDYELNVNVSFELTGGAATAGLSVAAGYTHNATTSSSESTIRSGSVASVPVGYEGYNFNWCLVAYNCNLQAGDSTQECMVINYLVKPNGSFPPAVPDNFKVKSQTLKGNTLQWDPATGAAGYRIARSTSLSDDFMDISGNITGKDTISYTDSNTSDGQTYYYTIVAYASKDSLPTAPLEVKTLYVTGITVKTQPKLVYMEGDPLDLSCLSVTLKLNNGTTQDFSYANFGRNNLDVSLGNRIALTAAHSGMPVTVTYTPNKLTANTNNLTVNAKSPYDLTCSVVFKVGNIAAAKLAPNKLLSAEITLTNIQPSAQQVLAILALYNNKGTMVQSACQSRNIAANATVNLISILNLPADINGYVAKVFVWDGTDFKSSTLIPKSPVFQIPSN